MIPADADVRVVALRASGALDPRARLVFDAVARRAADIFDVPMAMVSLITDDAQIVNGAFGALPTGEGEAPARAEGEDFNIARSFSLCGHVVANAKALFVPDLSKDLRFAGNPALKGKVRFYAGAPLRVAAGHVIGTLCLLDAEPRLLSERDLKLLEALADDAMESLRTTSAAWSHPATPPDTPPGAPSAIVGQMVPSGA